jgi:drug/metabolite transporter superfamily protein YnfA
VVIAGILVLLEGVGLLVLAVATLFSGLSEGIAIGRTLAQTGYYVVLALLLAACANGVLRGRRWGRTPCLVAQVVLVLIGVWLIAPSGRYLWGASLIVLAGITGYLLVSRPANAWINRFPLPFAEPDR